MLTARFEEALVFAARLHAGQTRKGSEIPYVSHLLAAGPERPPLVEALDRVVSELEEVAGMSSTAG